MKPVLEHLRQRMRVMRHTPHPNEQYGRPRVHGNGFIQIDVTDRVRMHVWGHPDIPCQETATPIHDHVFGFISQCVVGRLFNTVYVRSRGGLRFKVYEPEIREGEDTVLLDTGRVVEIDRRYKEVMDTIDNSYYMSPYVFHETYAPGPTVTIMQKDGPTLAQGAARKPRVLVPLGLEPDNEFSRYDASEEDLWRIVDDVLGI